MTKDNVVRIRNYHSQSLWHRIWKNKMIYTLLIPGIIWYIIFAYGPMGGLTLAFKKYMAKAGIWGSPFVGMKNYINVFSDPDFMKSVWRTLSINLGRLIFQFPVAIILAIALNEVKYQRYKKLMQSVYTFPHFLSWIVVSAVLTNLLSIDGLVNTALKSLGLPSISFLSDPKLFQPMLYITEVWKSSGYNAVIYLAAITGISLDQYEAAEIDGATRMQRITHITIPNILPTISVMFVLATGSIMSAGFDQVFNLSNVSVKSVSEILDMYIYRITFQSSTDFSFSMAVSLFRSVINLIFLFIADRGSKAIGGSGLLG